VTVAILPLHLQVLDMARLFILRHGKTEKASPTGHDIDRRLVGRGKNNAVHMGKQINEHMQRPDLVLTSPAERARATAEHATAQLGDIPIISEYRIYQADGEALLNVLTYHARNSETVLLIGHNPGLVILVLMLMDDNGSQPHATISDFPTCALAELSFETPHVGGIEPNSGTLVSLLRPRDLSH
jgi:phosphohistidine phosphatase